MTEDKNRDFRITKHLIIFTYLRQNNILLTCRNSNQAYIIIITMLTLLILKEEDNSITLK